MMCSSKLQSLCLIKTLVANTMFKILLLHFNGYCEILTFN